MRGGLGHQRHQNAFQIVHHIAIPEANDFVAFVVQIRSSILVVFGLRSMLPAIELNNQPRRHTYKVHYVRANGHLTAKLERGQTSIAQLMPVPLLGVGLSLTELFCSFASLH
jgi:hypothetical protein